MEDEDKKVPEDPKEEEKPLSIVDEAKAIREDIVKAKEELKAENDRKEKLQANELLGSSAGGRVEAPQISEEERARQEKIKSYGNATGAQWAKDMDKKQNESKV